MFASRLRSVALMAVTCCLGAAGNECTPSSAEPTEEGWTLLSGPDAAKYWGAGYGKPFPRAGWKIDGVCLILDNPVLAPSLFSKELLRDFELAFEWKIEPGVNSGVKYGCVPGVRHPQAQYVVGIRAGIAGVFLLLTAAVALWVRSRRWVFQKQAPFWAGAVVSCLLASMTIGAAIGALSIYLEAANFPAGLEYQIIDRSHPDATSNPTHRTAALYDLLPAPAAQPKPAGQFNQARIRVSGDQVEHWLNGLKVLEYRLGSSELRAAISASKFHAVSSLAEKTEGLLELQNHGGRVYFRNLRAKRLPQ